MKRFLSETTIGNIVLGFMFIAVLFIVTLPLHAEESETEEQAIEQPEEPEIEMVLLTEDDYEQIRCMAINSYFEARSEPRQGIIAVHNVVLNRVADSRFPNTPCEVIYQRNRRGCQFSWYCDGKSDTPRDLEAWATAIAVAYLVKMNYNHIVDITYGADHYHADYVDPEWASYEWIQHVATIETHIFYKSKEP